MRLLEFSNKEKSKFSKFVLFSIVINIFFIWFPSFDHVNIAEWINSASYLQNSVPSFFNSPWPGGPFFLSLFIPLGLSYSLSGYSEIFSVIILKIILFFFTFITGFLVYSIISKSNKKLGQTAFLFTLLNPGIIYVNYFWSNLDIFPVFFVALFYYFSYYSDSKDKTFVRSLLTTIPLVIAIFSFYYAVLIIPTIIIFSRNWKERINFILSVLILGISLYIAEIFLFRGGEFNLVSSLVPTDTGLYYQGLQRIVIIPSIYLISVIGLLSFVFPLILKKFGFSASVPILLIFMVTLYTSSSAGPDNFLWLYPFSILAITENSSCKPKLSSFLITSSFFWTGILFINLYDGTGIQVGIFYWAYNVLHMNIIFIHTNSQWVISTLIYFIVLTASFIGTIIYVIFYPQKRLNTWNMKQSYNNWVEVHPINRAINYKHIKSFVIIFVIIILVTAMLFNCLVPQVLNNSPIKQAPAEIFLTQYPNGVVAFPIKNNTYTVNGNSIFFYKNYNIIKMTRNLSTEYINLSTIETFNSKSLSKIELFNTSDFVIYASNSTFLNLYSYKSIAPNFTNAGKLSMESIPSVSEPIEYNNFSKNTIRIYNSNYFTSSCYYTLLFKVQHDISPSSHFNQTVVFGLYNGSTAIDLVVYNNSGILSYDYNNKHMNINDIYYNNSPDGWNILTLKSNRHGLIVGINGQNLFLNGSFFGGDSKLYIGKQGQNQSTHSFTGMVSQLYSSKVNMISNKIYTSVVSSKSKIISLNVGDKLTVNISDSGSGTILSVIGNRIIYNKPISYLITGKLNAIPYKLSIKFNELHLWPRNNKGFYMVPVFFALSTPFIVAIISIIDIYYKRL